MTLKETLFILPIGKKKKLMFDLESKVNSSKKRQDLLLKYIKTDYEPTAVYLVERYNKIIKQASDLATDLSKADLKMFTYNFKNAELLYDSFFDEVNSNETAIFGKVSKSKMTAIDLASMKASNNEVKADTFRSVKDREVQTSAGDMRANLAKAADSISKKNEANVKEISKPSTAKKTTTAKKPTTTNKPTTTKKPTDKK